MSSPLIPQGTETENKWSLTPLFSQGPGSDLTGCGTWVGADVRRLAAELSSGLSARHNGEGTAALLLLPRAHSVAAADHSTACSVASLTTQSACSQHDDPVSNWSIEVGRHLCV